MKHKFSIALVAVMLAAPVMAEKPVWAGKGKPTDEQKEEHRSAMESKESMDDEYKVKKEKYKNKTDKSKAKAKSKIEGGKKDGKEELVKSKDTKSGLEKQNEMKSEQVQKELDKGSEKGQESREQRKKWWKFWGDDNS